MDWKGHQLGTLYLVPTPIGNLEDITLRSLRILREADFIAAEDTRHTRKLLTHYDIHPAEYFSYHEHNFKSSGERIIQLIEQGQSGALVTDAGMPGISDPGEDIVAKLRAMGCPAIVLPGASAALTALIGSGLPTSTFTFVGFLSREAKVRRLELAAVKHRKDTLIFYEAPHRIKKMLRDAKEILGDRLVVIARELSKVHEEYIQGRLSQCEEFFGDDGPRGEMVIVIAGQASSDQPEQSSGEAQGETPGASEESGPESQLPDIVQLVNEYISKGLPYKEAMRATAKDLRISRRQVYQELLNREVSSLTDDAPRGMTLEGTTDADTKDRT